MFGFHPLSRRSSSRRPLSPLGSSRFEQPLPERYERRLHRRESSRAVEQPGYGEPDMTRMDSSRSRRGEYPSFPSSSSSSPSRHRRAFEDDDDDYGAVDLSALAGGYDPNPTAPRPSTRYSDFDRLYDDSSSSSPRRHGHRSNTTTTTDYLDRLGSGYDREPFFSSSFFPSSSSRSSYRPSEPDYYYPQSSSSARRDDYNASSGSGRSSRHRSHRAAAGGGGSSSVAEMLGGPFGGAGRAAGSSSAAYEYEYEYPDDGNRYVYPLRRSGERRRPRRSYR